MENKIELHKERDFSSVLGDSVTFVKQNFKQMGKSLILIATPPFVIASLIFGMVFVKDIEIAAAQSEMGNTFGAQSAVLDAISNPMTWLAYLLYFVAFLLIVTVILAYIKLYNERTDGSEITPGQVWQSTIRMVGRLIAFTIGYFILFVIIYFILALVLGVIVVGILGVVMQTPVVGMILLVAFITFFIMAIATYVTVLLPVIVYEKADFFGTLSRAASLLRGSFWQTFAITFVAYILVFVFGLAFSFLKEYLVSLAKTGTGSMDSATINAIFIIYFAITPVIMLVTYAFQLSVSSFTYYSLLEKRDHVGLKMKVDTIADTNTNLPDEQY